MRTIKLLTQVTVTVVLFVTIEILAGCAAKKSIWGDAKNGFILEYNAAEGENLQYDLTSDFTQGMEIMGQHVDITSNSKNVFTMQAVEEKSGNYKFKVMIDTVFMIVESPRGKIEPDMNAVIGESFDFIISNKGKELDYSGAESLKYVFGMSEEKSLATDFQALFPNLPDKPVRKGESWNYTDTINEKGNTGFLQIISQVENTVEGIESFKGYDCVKIFSKNTGKLEGSGFMQGIDTKTSGDIESTDIWYFAYKEGLFVKMTSEGKATSTTTTSGERVMTIPSTRDYAIVTELIK